MLDGAYDLIIYLMINKDQNQTVITDGTTSEGVNYSLLNQHYGRNGFPIQFAVDHIYYKHLLISYIYILAIIQ